MATFSPSDAALEGFQLIRRHWRVVVGWSIFNLVALVALVVVLLVAVAGVAPLVTRDAAGTVAAVLLALIVGLGSALVEIVIWCGLLRLELAPDAPGFLHLRIGRDELRVIGAALLVAVAAVPVFGAVILLAWLAAHVSVAAGFAVGLAALVAAYLVMLRLGLTPTIAFAERRISLVESWRRTRGQSWRLLGMALLLLCLVALIGLVIWIATFVVSGLTTGFADMDLTGAEAFAAHPGRYLFETGVQLLLAPAWIVVGQAPWIAVYRSLTPEGA